MRPLAALLLVGWLAVLPACVDPAMPGRPGLAGNQERLIQRATLAVDGLRADDRFAGLGLYLQNAYGVVVIPDTLEGGLVLGARFGSGVLMLRNAQTRSWSQPVFYDLYGGSLGLQAGGQTSDVVLTLMNPGAVNRLLNYRVSLGVDVGLAVGQVGAGVGVGTTANFGEDVYAFTKNQGLYGGFSLEGGFLAPKRSWNAVYYGRPLTPEEIVRSAPAGGPAAAGLQASLAAFERSAAEAEAGRGPAAEPDGTAGPTPLGAGDGPTSGGPTSGGLSVEPLAGPPAGS